MAKERKNEMKRAIYVGNTLLIRESGPNFSQLSFGSTGSAKLMGGMWRGRDLYTFYSDTGTEWAVADNEIYFPEV